MEFPTKGSSKDRLLRTLFEHGPLTMEQGIAIHLHFGTRDWSTRAVYSQCLKLGLIDLKGKVYHLMPHVANYLRTCDPLPVQEKNGELVKPRQYNCFATTLSAKNIPSVIGMRAGSNDFKLWPSRFA